WAITHATQHGLDGVGLSNGAIHGVRWAATRAFAEAHIIPMKWKDAKHYPLLPGGGSRLVEGDTDPKFLPLSKNNDDDDFVVLKLFFNPNPTTTGESPLGIVGEETGHNVIVTKAE